MGAAAVGGGDVSRELYEPLLAGLVISHHSGRRFGRTPGTDRLDGGRGVPPQGTRVLPIFGGLEFDEADVAPGENAVAAQLAGFGVRAAEIESADDAAVTIAGSTDCFPGS